MIDNNEIVCLDKTLAEIMKEIQLGKDENFRDGSRPDIDELRKLRDKAYDFAKDVQNKIDREIQESNGWGDFKGKYVRVIQDDNGDVDEDGEEKVYMHVFDIKRLYKGCTFRGDVIMAYDDSYFIHKCYELSFKNPSDVEIITKEEFDDFVKKTIENITI